MGVLLLVSLLAQSSNYKAALEALTRTERARDPDLFAEAARKLLRDDSARAVREVVEAYGRLADAPPALEAAVHYRLHSELAQALGAVGSGPGQAEIVRQRDRAKAWASRLVCLDAAAFKPVPLDMRGGAIAALRDRAPAVTRRALQYLKHDRKLLVVDAIVTRYLEVDLPKGPKGDDWNRLRLAFREALGTLLRVNLPAAVDYRGYVEARREKPDDLFNKPAPPPGLTQLTIFGAEVTGNNIAFVIDISGSMMSTDPVVLPAKPSGKTVVQGGKTEAQAAEEAITERRRITRAKRELSKVVQALPEGKRFNIIAYSSDVVPWKKLLAPVSAASRKDALEFIAGLKADGITVTDDAMEAAFADLAVDTIYLITDGAPTHVGNRGAEMPPDAPEIIDRIHRRVREVNYFRGVRVFTLGFPEAEENFLKKLSADNGGQYTPIR